MNKMTMSMRVVGGEAVKATMRRLISANKDLTQPLTLCSFRMERSVAENFRAQGIPEIGVKWPKLSKMTLRMREARTTRHGRNKDKILLDTGTLRNSYTRLGSTGSYRKIRNRKLLEFGSALNYAKKQQEGFTNPGGTVQVEAFTRKKTSAKRRSKKNAVRVRAHTRTVKPSRVPSRPHLTIKPRDVLVFNKIFSAWEKMAMSQDGAR